MKRKHIYLGVWGRATCSWSTVINVMNRFAWKVIGFSPFKFHTFSSTLRSLRGFLERLVPINGTFLCSVIAMKKSPVVLAWSYQTKEKFSTGLSKSFDVWLSLLLFSLLLSSDKLELKRRRTERIRRERIDSSLTNDMENRRRSRANSQSDPIRRGRGRPKTVGVRKQEEEKGEMLAWFINPF